MTAVEIQEVTTLLRKSFDTLLIAAAPDSAFPAAADASFSTAGLPKEVLLLIALTPGLIRAVRPAAVRFA